MRNRARLFHLWAIGLILILSSSSAVPALANPLPAPLMNAYDVISAVNQLRESNGLPAYQVNGSLMASAQSHSEYQASIGQVTHTGQGGSNAKSRAIAAGYGGGANVFVSENIYGGSNASAQAAVSWWMGDVPHQNTMLSPNYTDVGAGVASNGSGMFYTLDVGYVAGSPGSGGTGSTVATSASGTGLTFIPVQISTPAPDGSIIHVVQSGQTLWTIAAAYKVELPEILKLNNLSDTTTIFPGNKILVKPALANPNITPESTGSPVLPTHTIRPGRTRTPSPTRTSTQGTPTLLPGETASSTNALDAGTASLDPILVIIIALVSGGVILTIVGIVIQRKT